MPVSAVGLQPSTSAPGPQPYQGLGQLRLTPLAPDQLGPLLRVLVASCLEKFLELPKRHPTEDVG